MMSAGTVSGVLLWLALAWGVFAFGAVYPWAHWPLAAGAAVSGVLSILSTRGSRVASRGLIIALCAIGLGVCLQLLPLSMECLERISPASPAASQQLDLALAAGIYNRHPISINPEATRRALLLYIAFAMLLLGTARLLSKTGAEQTIWRLSALGALVAVVGLALPQSADGKVYGLWTPESIGTSFGPFVNKNHFAGWMIMACPLALGLLAALIARGGRGRRLGVRNRLIWFGTSSASRMFILGSLATLMILSLFLTQSRSGIATFCVGATVGSWFVIRASASSSRKIAAVMTLFALLFLAAVFVGMETLTARFQAADWAGLGHRRGAWGDAIGVISRFSAAGTGLNTYGDAMVLFQTYATFYHFSAPHNAYLQIAAEGGVLLTVPTCIAVVFLARDIRRRFRDDAGRSSYWMRAGATVSLVTIALQEFVDFSLQMPANAALFAVVCGIALHAPPARHMPTVPHHQHQEVT